MLLNHTNLRKTLMSLDKARVLSLVCNRNLHSICAVFVFTQILKKELLKYQIEFKDMESTVNFQFEASGETYTLSNSHEGAEHCSCGRREVVGVSILYTVIKAMSLLKVETLWPVIVCFIYYRVFTDIGCDINRGNNEEDNKENSKGSNRVNDKENNRVNNDTTRVNNDTTRENNKANDINKANKTNTCPRCTEMVSELTFSVKLLSSKSDGVFIIKRNNLEFLGGSTVMHCIKSDLRFIHEKKLFYTRRATADRKIGEFLARRGVSIASANESYLGLDSHTKSLCGAAFGEHEKFVLRLGHDIELSAVEHAFLVMFYMYRQRNMYAYMSLDKRKLVDLEKAARFYQKMVGLFKEATQCASRVGNVMIFGVKGEMTVEQAGVVGQILDQMFRVYLRYRGDAGGDICVVHTYTVDKGHIALYTEDIDCSGVAGMKKEIEILGERLVKMPARELGEFIRLFKR